MEIDDNFIVAGDNPYLLVKKTSVYWNYKNIFTGFNDRINGSQGRTTFVEGYWTFQMLADKF